jgi:L-ribulose-5-phosphate 3-epimerase
VIDRIGFMQGRLSPIVNGMIQSFPWNNWREEICDAASLGLSKMEWTLDQDRLYENPLMTIAGREEIITLSQEHKLLIPSLTGDCFMQAPFWKVDGAAREARQQDFIAIMEACSKIGVSQMVVPLVDNGSVQSQGEALVLRDFLLSLEARLASLNMRVIFESDYAPRELANFIATYPAKQFGINYDTGNSAAMGFDVKEEFQCYGGRVTNVHIKDRVLAGTTIALGEGNTDFESVFEQLSRVNYTGNLILQTARAKGGDHFAVLTQYRDLTLNYLQAHGA